MRAGRVIAAVAVGTAAVIVGPMAQPAGAAIVVGTVGGNTVQVNATGTQSITPGCGPTGKVTINNVIAAPAIDCSAMVQLTVAGDSGAQILYGSGLDQPAFSSHPKIVASFGDGADLLFESPNADNVDMGPGDDQVLLFFGGTANTGIDLGAGSSDQVVYQGSDLADTIAAVSVNAGATITQSNPNGGSSTSFANAERLTLNGHKGNDTITSTGVTTASSITSVSIYGYDGDDTISDGAGSSQLYGGPGTNSLSGGGGFDAYWTESQTDSLNGGNDTVNEFIYDTEGLRSGGRTLTGFTAADTYVVQAHQGDVTMRIRPGTAGSTTFTTSLTRPGQQLVPASIGKVALGQAYVGATPHRGLADVVAGGKPVQVTLPMTGGGLVDVTVPSGVFDATLTGHDLVVQSAYGQVNASYVDDAAHFSVHGPWTNKNQGFAHRAYRDLLFRFPTNTVRDQVRDQLTAGTKTRAAVAQGLIDTDEYRGLDVDRVFVKYLHRTSDPSGRTYWINALRGGRALWRFRAQLFGSNEYFSKAGGSNAAYVTQAYNDALGRNPDPSGQAYWTNKLNAGAERGMVALQFINSAEARRRLVDDQFLRFLDRLPTTAEQAEWSAAVSDAGGEQALIADLVASNAYFNRS